ncbi:hypothetical protein BKA56DRAFT_609466 [Ilyonectria sp. MPI-CAGE-AT-0026]|nr:hypothetical protein BKA56DRAFT_609466 [Ilyonectria sp. MPI-CAGE-AT-0026]
MDPQGDNLSSQTLPASFSLESSMSAPKAESNMSGPAATSTFPEPSIRTSSPPASDMDMDTTTNRPPSPPPQSSPNSHRPETVLPRLTRLRLQEGLRDSGRTGVSTEEILSIDDSGHRTADDILLCIGQSFNEPQPPSQLESDVVMQGDPSTAAAPPSDPVAKALTEMHTDNKKRLAERRRRRAVNGSRSGRAHPKPRR